MMAGAGVNSGAGMLRARRKDISIKPNRRLDRKSSRGMIYENEELRLRTIHINAAIEQGQNDIKKLRKENEQLRREIWCLRDEYDKLEEILRKQKSHDGSDECESRLEDNEATQLSNSEKDEEDINDDFFDDVDADNDDNENLCNNFDDIRIEDNNEDDDNSNDDDDDDDDDEDNEDNDNETNEDCINAENRDPKENRREARRIDNDQSQNSDILKLEKPRESEKLNDKIPKNSLLEKANNLDHLQINFDGLSIVDEEEEQRRVRKYEDDSRQNQFSSSPNFNTCPFIFLATNQSSQIFDSTSTLKFDSPLPESSNSKSPKSPKPSVTFENNSPNKLYQECPQFFAKKSQTFSNSENRKIEVNSSEITPLNVKPKQIFAPLKIDSRKLFFAKKLPGMANEISRLSKNEIFIHQSPGDDSRELNRIFKSEKRKSISLENLSCDKMQNFANNSKLFLSCRNLNSLEHKTIFDNRSVNFRNDANFPNTIETPRDNFDSSRSFKSQLSVILKSPKEISKTPQHLSKNCASLNNLLFQNGEISAFNQEFPLLNDKERYHGYQATSFEGPFPITLQIPSMLPIEMDYKNIPFLSRKFYYPGEEMKFFYDSIPQKISAHTQTLDEDVPQECARNKKDLRIKTESLDKNSTLNRSRKKSSKKEKLEKKSFVDRRKRDVLKNQVSISSCDESESPNAIIAGANFENRENKHESRSSSSDVDSQRKEQTHRVSIYFNSKKRPSLTSMKSTRNTDNSKSKIIPQKDHSDGNAINSGEPTNSVNSKEIGNSRRRKSSSSENVPWCACWGNGCI